MKFEGAHSAPLPSVIELRASELAEAVHILTAVVAIEDDNGTQAA